MDNKKIRVLVVDDSAFMRRALKRMLCSDPLIEVVDTGVNGEEAYEKVKALRPDVVTLDIRMPGMDGLTALRKIMADCPVPVIMLSSLTSEGGEYSLKALDYGAVDFIDKSSAHTSMDILGIADELIAKVKAVSGADVSRMAPSSPPPPRRKVEKNMHVPGSGWPEVVAIGASTGGPPALQTIISDLPADLPAAILVVQHMPIGFTASLAERLNSLSQLGVSEAFDGDTLLPGRCLIAPSGWHMTLARDGGALSVRLSKEPQGLLHRPSVDVLMESVAKVMGKRALGVLLTGMGSDGARGMKALHESGARTIAQDEGTCVVYGMPKVAVELGGVETSLPLNLIPSAIMEGVGVT